MTRKSTPGGERERSALVASLAALLQSALEVHEELELATGRSPVAELCEVLGLDPLAVPLELLATVVFGFLVLGEPALTRSQEKLQAALLERLERAPRMLFRQLRTEPLRAWRYLPQPASRDVAAQLAGPDAAREEFFDALIDLARARVEPRGGACIGWPLTTAGGGHVLVAAALLSPASEAAVEALAPFPMPRSERAFWNEQLGSLLALCVDPHGTLRTATARDAEREVVDPAAFRDGARLALYPPAHAGELLERLIVAADFALVASGSSFYTPRLQRVRHTRELIARARLTHELDALLDALATLRFQLLGGTGQGRFTGRDDPALEAWLPLERVLDGLGVRRDATMPAAETHALKAHPVSVLALDPRHALFDEVHLREPIRQALDWARRHPEPGAAVQEAFERYTDERRWLATLAPLELSREDHLARIDLASIHHALTALFDPRAAATPLDALGLDSRHVGWLEAALRPRPHTDANALRLRDLPDSESGLLAVRNLGQGALVGLKRALLRHADGWRAFAIGLDPRSLDASAAAGARGAETRDASLVDGLDELAALFGDGSEP